MTIWRMCISHWVHFRNTQYLSLFHYHNCCTNAPQSYVTLTLAVLLMKNTNWWAYIKMYTITYIVLYVNVYILILVHLLVLCNKLFIHARIRIPLIVFIFFGRYGPNLAMASSFMWFLEHTKQRNTLGKTPLEE